MNVVPYVFTIGTGLKSLLSYFYNIIPKKLTASEILEQLKIIQETIHKRSVQIDERIQQTFQEAKQLHKKGDKKKAIYKMRLKKLYNIQKEKLDQMSFNLDTNILQIENINLLTNTASSLKKN